MRAESRATLAAALGRWMPAGVSVVDHVPDTRAPPFVYLEPAGHAYRSSGLRLMWNVSLVLDAGLAASSRAPQADELFDLVLAAVAEVAVLAECTSTVGTQLLGDIGHPKETVSVPMFHAACELPQAATILTAVR